MPAVKAGNYTIHYESAGMGLPLLLLHGLGSSSRSWSRQLESLSKWFKVIAWDAPGYGASSDPAPSTLPSMKEFAKSLDHFINALGIGPFSILGHSMGGIIALEFCKDHPDRKSVV